jgi:PAT family beta-lactamase induction signal transducer AmpG
MKDEALAARSSPWLFVPTLYFLQGVPYFVVNTAATTFFASIGVPLPDIGHAASLLALPWTLKPLWSPAVDLLATKRAWVLAMQALLVAAIASLAFAATSSHAVLWTVVVCAWIAIASATHDIAVDGFYLLALESSAQASFVGVRNAAYRLGRIFVTGTIVYLAGAAEEFAGGRARAWALAFGVAAAVYAAGLLACALGLPRPETGPAGSARREREPGRFREAVASYFTQPRIAGVIAFILLYRFGESMLTTMSTPFLLKEVEHGGLGLPVATVGFLSGTVGVLALISGGVLGGFCIARFGVRACLWPMALAMHLPNVLYAWAAFTKPGLAAIAGVIAVEQLGYGFGFSAYMVVLMRISQGRGFATTLYALSTGIMALSAQAASYVSGDLAARLGFDWFFVAICASAIPSLATLFFLPKDLESRGVA